MNELMRRHAGIGLGASICMALAVLGLASMGASADDGILVLSSKHLGMTGEEIVESGKRGEVEPSVSNETEGSEWRSNHDEASAAVCPPVAAAERAVRSFEGCVESAIRAGNGYAESSRVCRSLFPERTAAAEEQSPETDAEAGSAVQ